MTKLRNEVIQKLKCKSCNHEGLIQESSFLKCKQCGDQREISPEGIVQDDKVEAFYRNTETENEEAFYEKDTKQRYQTTAYADYYLQQYKAWYKPKNLYHAWVARRECAAVERLLSQIPDKPNEVLDLPAGTGKLAAVHHRFGYQVLAGDVSLSMLRMGTREWVDPDQMMGMIQMDSTNTHLLSDSFDLVICLRLIHRLNENMARRILSELSRISRKYVMISYGVTDPTLAGLISPKKRMYADTDRARLYSGEWKQILSEYGNLLKTEFVSRGISEEMVTLIDIS